jgi:hypothetical protein
MTDAVEWQTKALALSPPADDLAGHSGRLELYKSGKPYHETRGVNKKVRVPFSALP